MYFVETGFGEAFKPREKAPPPKPPRKAPVKTAPKGPQDRFIEVYTLWDLWVPFKKDFAAFTQEAAKAIARHVAASESAKVTSLLVGQQKNVKSVHDAYSSTATESNFVIIRANLRFTRNNHTGFDWLHIELPTLSLKDSIK
jgi:hypothetical protein